MAISIKKIIGIFLCSFGLVACSTASQEPLQAQEILEFWLGPLQTGEHYPKDKAAQWFEGGEAVDHEIRNRFEKQVIAAAKHELDAWKNTPRGRLALIILVDQFTRNIYRGTPEAFACDNIAVELAIEGIIQGHDLDLLPIERVFFYLPLEHSENLSIQKMSVHKFKSILPDVPLEEAHQFMSFVDYAEQHYEMIAHFGRFPHRNEILGRESTPEEMDFLSSPRP